jgi:hypothetical protein
MKHQAKKGNRSMRKLVAAVIAAAIVGCPTVAHAAPSPTAPPAAAKQSKPDGTIAGSLRAGVKPMAAPNGLLYVYSDDMGEDVTYSGNSTQWPTGWNNQVDQLWNNGFPGAQDDVNIYDYPWHVGAYACIGNGDFWNLREDDYVFSWVHDHDDSGFELDPLWETVHDRGTSHKWVDWCGNNNTL